MARKKKETPVHPGEVLREDHLVPMKLTAYALAKIEPRAPLSIVIHANAGIQ